MYLYMFMSGELNCKWNAKKNKILDELWHDSAVLNELQLRIF